MRQTGAATTTLGAKFKATALAAAKLAAAGAALGLGVAAVAAVKFAKAAAEDQQQATLMAQAFRTAAGATDAQVASTERWISAQGRALGVTDDELRPALSKLATATGSVAKAQKLTSLAMDVSAGSQKSLSTVSAALAKAQSTGSVAALAKYGAATKDAAGNTLSLAQVTQSLADKYGGAATAKANTFQGQLDRLKLVAAEAGEAIGYKLIPLLTRFSGWMLSTGIPALTKFGKGVKEQISAAFNAVQPALTKFGSILQEQVFPALSSVFNFLNGNRPVVIAFAAVLGVGAIALGVFSIAMAAVNAVMLLNPITLVVVALAALAAALTYAYTHSEKFRAIVDAAWAGIKAATSAVFPVITKTVSVAFDVLKTIFLNFTGPGLIIKHWDKIKSATSAAWGVIKSLVSAAIGVVKAQVAGIQAVVGVVTGAWNSVRSATSSAWNAVKDAVQRAVTSLVNAVEGIKGKVTGALTGAATLLYNAGVSIIQGLIDGINSMIGKVTGKLKELTDKIPDWKGPPAKDKTLLRQAGRDILDGLIAGFDDGLAGVETSLEKLTNFIASFFDKKLAKVKKTLSKTLDGKELAKALDRVEAKLDKQQGKILKGLKAQEAAIKANAKAQDAANAALTAAREKLAALQDTAAQYAESIKQSVVAFGDIVSLGANTGYSSAAQLVDLLKARVQQATQFAAVIKALTAAGLNQTAIQQLIDAGVEGGLGTAQAVLDGGPAAIAQINALQAQLAAVGTDLGTSTANTMYAAGIQAAQGLVDGLAANADALAAQANKLAKQLVKAVKKALGIASPSKVFRGLGRQTTRGLVIGLEDVNVRRAGVTLANTLAAGFGSPALAAYVDDNGAGLGGNTYVTVTVEVSPTADKVSIGREIASSLDAFLGAGGRVRAA